MTPIVLAKIALSGATAVGAAAAVLPAGVAEPSHVLQAVVGLAFVATVHRRRTSVSRCA